MAMAVKFTPLVLPLSRWYAGFGQIGADWEEGVWTMRFLADGREAGAGQFWLARDPSRFDFAAALRKQ